MEEANIPEPRVTPARMEPIEVADYLLDYIIRLEDSLRTIIQSRPRTQTANSDQALHTATSHLKKLQGRFSEVSEAITSSSAADAEVDASYAREAAQILHGFAETTRDFATTPMPSWMMDVRTNILAREIDFLEFLELFFAEFRSKEAGNAEKISVDKTFDPDLSSLVDMLERAMKRRDN